MERRNQLVWLMAKWEETVPSDGSCLSLSKKGQDHLLKISKEAEQSMVCNNREALKLSTWKMRELTRAMRMLGRIEGSVKTEDS